MNRSRLAEVLLGIVSVAVNRRVEVVFGYAPAKYQRYKSDSAEIRVKEPVAAEFAGWSGNLDLPLSCVIGLGYEPHRAIGILEFVEPRWACAYEPRGVDTKYDRDVMKVNGPLRAAVPAPLITEYSVRDAWGTYKRLSSLVYGLRSSTRPILVPMGPKIFGLLCMIVALESENEVSVWRVSGGESEPPVDRQASGSIASLGLTLGPVNDSDNAGH